MKIDFNSIEAQRMPQFKGGAGEFIVKTQADINNKIMYGRLQPGSSVGYHKHVGNSEIIYVIEGCGVCNYEGDEERLVAGDCHYCPQGHSHSLTNSGSSDLVFLAIVPQH